MSRRLENWKRTFAEFTSMMKASFIYLGPMGNKTFLTAVTSDILVLRATIIVL